MEHAINWLSEITYSPSLPSTFLREKDCQKMSRVKFAHITYIAPCVL